MFDEDDVRQNRDDATGGATNDPRQEVTYEVFAQQMWKSVKKKKKKKKRKKKKFHYQPILVWMEIKSFIKGGFKQNVYLF